VRTRLLVALIVFAGLSPSAALARGAPVAYPRAVLTEVGGVPFTAESDAGAVLTGMQIFISAGLQRQSSAESGVAALLAETIMRTQGVRDAIAAQGGTLTYSMEGRCVHYYLEARPAAIVPFLALFAQALEKPDFSVGNLGAARRALIGRIGEGESNPLAVGIEMFKRSYYVNGAGLPATGTRASLEHLDGDKVAAFYARTYKREGVGISVAGSITPELIAGVAAFARALPDGRMEPLSRAVKALSAGNGTRIIAQRDVGAPFLVMGFAAPSPADKNFGAMLLLESLLAQSFDRTAAVTPTLAQRTISAFYLYDSEPASFVVFVNGSRVEPTLALREISLVTQALAEKQIQGDSLERFKAAALGALLSDTLTLADRSYLIGTLQQEGLPADALNSVLAALNATTAADVQRVAKEYLQKYIVAIVLPRTSQGDQEP
jgi:predicted Zn-dependent peptidase